MSTLDPLDPNRYLSEGREKTRRSLGRAYRQQRRLNQAQEAFAARWGIAYLAANIDDVNLREQFERAALATLPREKPPTPRQVTTREFAGLSERAHAATRWLLAEKDLGDSPRPTDWLAAAERVDRSAFIDAGLGGMLAILYGGSVCEALSNVVPRSTSLPDGHTGAAELLEGRGGRECARIAMRWMLAQLGLEGTSPPELAEKATQAEFIRFGLQGMPATVYGSSRFSALSDILPELRPWQMGTRVPQGYWKGEGSRERARDAKLWLLKAAELVVA